MRGPAEGQHDRGHRARPLRSGLASVSFSTWLTRLSGRSGGASRAGLARLSPLGEVRRRESSGPSSSAEVRSPRWLWNADGLVVASLGELVHARAGDKGGDANLGVWVREAEAWDWLQSTLTVEEPRALARTSELASSFAQYDGAAIPAEEGARGAVADSGPA
ncbi:AtuA-related protein [Kribbella steppae]|uniref:AtuA-related protein n=1 Tax=Kribbella steppae TaxID=2512223 RepID=UPI003F72043D